MFYLLISLHTVCTEKYVSLKAALKQEGTMFPHRTAAHVLYIHMFHVPQLDQTICWYQKAKVHKWQQALCFIRAGLLPAESLIKFYILIGKQCQLIAKLASKAKATSMTSEVKVTLQ